MSRTINGDILIGRDLTVTRNATINGTLTLNSTKITNLADPTNPQDACTKAYADALKQGFDVKDSVRLATTGSNITLSGLLSIDGVQTVATDRVLVKDQTTASSNGIYVVSSGAWSRATDAASSANVTSGLYTWVTEGSTQSDTGWLLTTIDPISLGSTSLSFAQFSGAGQIVAGAGISKSGNTISLASTISSATTFTNSLNVPTQTAGNNTTLAASTAFVQTAISGTSSATSGFVYIGGVNITSTPPSSPTTGDLWVITTGGTPNGGYTWRTTVTTTNIGDYIVYNGTNWDYNPNSLTVVSAGTGITVTPTGNLQYTVNVGSTVVQTSGANLTGPVNANKGTNLSSATTTNIGAATGEYVHITGTTTITGFDTIQAGTLRHIVFDGILTLTHNATSLILPTAANITTAAGDVAIMRSEGSGNWRCVSYNKASGAALTGSGGGTGSLPIGSAGGTVNAITVTIAGATSTDKQMIAVVSAGANTTTTPNLNLNSGTAYTITTRGGQAPAVGDIGPAGYVGIYEYNGANTHWELLNPVSSAGGGSGSTYVTGNQYVQDFIAGTNFTAGTTTTLTLAVTPLSSSYVTVYFDIGVQHHNTWSLTGNVITFTSPIPTGTGQVEVVINGISNSAIFTTNSFASGSGFTGGSTTQLTLSSSPNGLANCMVFFDGVYQQHNQYTLSGSVITFNSAIPVGISNVEVQVLGGGAGSGGLTWNTITTNTTAVSGNEYRCNSASQLLVTLPASPADGDKVGVVGVPVSGTGGWKLAPNTSQTLWYGQQSTTAGFVGTAASSGVWEYISSASAWRYLYGTSDFTVGTVPGDPFFANVTLLIPGNGSIQDFSGNVLSLTNTGVTFDTTNTKYTASSMAFNGSSSGLTYGVHSAFKFPGNYCIEFWVKFNAVNVNQTIFQCGSSMSSASGMYIYLRGSDGKLCISNSGLDQSVVSSALSSGTWYHCAVMQIAGQIGMAVGGAVVGFGTYGAGTNTDGYCYIGRSSSATQYLNGYLAHFRITNGFCRYAAGFTVPAVPFYTAQDTTADALWQNQVLCCNFDSNFNDSSGNAITLTNTGSVVISNSVFKVGSGSAQFNGSNQLQNTSISALPFVLGSWLMRFWAYPTANGAGGWSRLVTVGQGAGTECGIHFPSGTTTPNLIWSGATPLASTGGNIPLNTWTEIELVYAAGYVTLFVGGQYSGSVSVSASTATSAITIGNSNGAGSAYYTGYIDNLEITGFGSPTANFTPWASAFLTAMPSGYDPFWQQTTLCLPFDGSATDVSGNGITLTNTGSVTFAATPKVGSGAAAFSGSNYLSVASGSLADVGTGDITFEAWVKVTTIGAGQMLFSTGTGGNYFVIQIDVSGHIYINFGVPGGISITTATLTAGTYKHVAYIKKGTTGMVFLDGALDTGSIAALGSQSSSLVGATIGAHSGGTNKFTGSLDQLRLTKAARYTANFTPPSTPFLTVGPV